MLLSEHEAVAPPRTVVERASLARYDEAYGRSLDDPDGSWAEAAEGFEWGERWRAVREFDGCEHRWFVGATITITVNALGRHVRDGRGNKLARLWLGEDGRERAVTYRMLLALVGRIANGLRALGVEAGDRVVVYMPLTM